MEPVEEKIGQINSLIKNGKKVKMRRADGVERVKSIYTKNGIVIVEFMDGEMLLLTKEQFLEREIIVEKRKTTNVDENEVENMLNTIRELQKEGYQLFFKGKKMTNIRKEGNYIITETEDGTIYTQSPRDFLESYKTAKVM
ncbi:conserved hypothetical protein [Betalipothrixvirus acidiani]|uniref:Uncharacterized protein n=1 Tax=Betalipothrixvirus acidiani TaxID=346881 RepID=A7WK95_9VIRU|nr:hypothetical protein AFV3_gp05 [Acidianus filamentous virus 3]CAJ31496.1 conserved hypothetical protein [Acidianus filamentous virus 3]